MPIRLDMSDVQDQSFEPLPDAVYNCIISDCEIRDSKSSDYQYANWEITVSDGEFKGRKIWTITSFSPKALWRLKEMLLALGETDEALGRAGYAFNEHDWIGQPLRVSVTSETSEYNGEERTRNVVKRVLAPVGGPAPKPAFR